MAKLRLQLIQGMTLSTLWRVLAENRFQVRGPGWPRLAMLVGLGAANSLLGSVENAANRLHIASSDFAEPPIFILGHWRSGTTLLHNLMVQDPRFAFVTQYQTTYPHHFVYSQPKGARLLGRITPPTRPQDQVALSMTTPQEDEFGLAAMSGLGFYTRLLFPNSPEDRRNGLDPEQWPADERERWERSLTLLVKKVATKNSRAERLVLKSPPHTARVPALLRLFPGAKFVHLVRDPYSVFLSTRHLWQSTLIHCHLHPPERRRVDEVIFGTYCRMMELYTAYRALIPAGDLVELRFEDLERDPASALGAVYSGLGLGGLERARGPVAEYLDSVRGYAKNRYGLALEDRRRVAERWGRWFEAWGYAIDPPESADCLGMAGLTAG